MVLWEVEVRLQGVRVPTSERYLLHPRGGKLGQVDFWGSREVWRRAGSMA